MGRTYLMKCTVVLEVVVSMSGDINCACLHVCDYRTPYKYNDFFE